mmetsp:Transcript_20135/g.47942  ORF Transcript_20135/g.47942 Transcript_20135/m.47942 type:complete len:236 (-) Transcript_20135:603-1310(-)
MMAMHSRIAFPERRQRDATGAPQWSLKEGRGGPSHRRTLCMPAQARGWPGGPRRFALPVATAEAAAPKPHRAGVGIADAGTRSMSGRTRGAAAPPRAASQRQRCSRAAAAFLGVTSSFPFRGFLPQRQLLRRISPRPCSRRLDPQLVSAPLAARPQRPPPRRSLAHPRSSRNVRHRSSAAAAGTPRRSRRSSSPRRATWTRGPEAPGPPTSASACGHGSCPRSPFGRCSPPARTS